jgi:hypothetical protein
VKVKPNQKVAAEPHAFPPDEQQRIVIRQHEQQHEEHEQIEEAEESGKAGFVSHVSGRIDVDEERDSGNQQDHQRTQLVEEKAPVRVHPGKPGTKRELGVPTR